MKTRKKLLVAGCSRSGTMAVSRMLRQLGLDVKHEQMGRDGTVSCYFPMDTDTYPVTGPSVTDPHPGEGRYSDYRFDCIVHLVRDPRKCIPSNAKIMSRNHQLWLEALGYLDMTVKPKLRRMDDMWCAVNERCEELTSARFQIERVTELLDYVADQLDTPKPAEYEIIHNHKGSGYLKAEPVTFQQLSAETRARAERYGYR